MIVVSFKYFIVLFLGMDGVKGQIYNCTSPGMYAITFDDGPHPTRTAEVLDALKTYNATATFFINGFGNWEPNETRYLETVLRIFQEGHQIGSHTWSHPHMTRLTPQEMRLELSRLADLLYQILQVNLTVFRPPFGDFNQELLQIAKDEFNYESILWNINTTDWKHPGNTKKGLKDYFRALESHRSDSYIPLHHDVQLGSANLARAAIHLMRSRGFQLVTIAECIGQIPPYHHKLYDNQNTNANLVTNIENYFIHKENIPFSRTHINK